MTDSTDQHDALNKIGCRISYCANAAMGIDLLSTDPSNNSSNLTLAISGISCLMEEQLKQISEELDEWVAADTKRQRDAQQ